MAIFPVCVLFMNIYCKNLGSYKKQEFFSSHSNLAGLPDDLLDHRVPSSLTIQSEH